MYLTAVIVKPNSEDITYKVHNRFRKQFNLITSWIRRDRSPDQQPERMVVSLSWRCTGGAGARVNLLGAELGKPCSVGQGRQVELSPLFFLFISFFLSVAFPATEFLKIKFFFLKKSIFTVFKCFCLCKYTYMC